MGEQALFSTNDIFKSYFSEGEFENLAIEVFNYQYSANAVYRKYCQNIHRSKVSSIDEIPFLPISFFKTHRLSCKKSEEIIFTSSGTTNNRASQHFVYDLEFYHQSFNKVFEYFYGSPEDYCILALLPSYLERSGSSLIYMANKLIEQSNNENSGFFLNEYEKLNSILKQNLQKKQKTLLIGVSFALLDFVEEFQLEANNELIVMETGGMKGRKKEMVREELHRHLSRGFACDHIHSEYGMTELLSQAYSKKNGIFHCPPWMKVMGRQQDDPFSVSEFGETAGLNIIDLANIHSCSFIAAEDLGKIYEDGSFEVLGRFDNSEVRGCNLMIS